MDDDRRGAAPPEGSRSAGRRLEFRQVFALAGLVTLVLVGGLLAITVEDRAIDGAVLMRWIDGLGPWGAAAVVILMVVHCFVPFPAEILALCAGAAFGAVLGTALVWSGAMLGAALSFALARYLGRAAVERFLAARYRAALDDWTRDQGAVTLLLSRFIPVIAFNLINYAAGLTRVGWWTFLWTTGVGILPITFLMVLMGARMTKLDWPLLLVVSAVGIVVIALLHRLARRRGWLEAPPRAR
jgi:uncharacterized membrane protein YdjX (TVP38/TMEM64 family)